MEVLKGAAECIARAKAVIVEVSFAEYYEGQGQFHEVVAFLATFRFYLAVLGDHTPRGLPLNQTDVLFLRQE
jgi:hypothetical protein